MGKEPRRTALVGFNMRPGMTDDGLIGLTEMSQRQTVGRRAVEHEKNLGIVIKQRAYGIGRPGSPVVKPIGRRTAGIGPVEILQGFRTKPGPIVAGKRRMIQPIQFHNQAKLRQKTNRWRMVKSPNHRHPTSIVHHSPV